MNSKVPSSFDIAQLNLKFSWIPLCLHYNWLFETARHFINGVGSLGERDVLESSSHGQRKEAGVLPSAVSGRVTSDLSVFTNWFSPSY